ncbi:MAG: hypothetical protein E6066_08005 [Oscillospiraceae bacterium]|nr:hypothetical protein [Oscillospiraceae bacterium]
MSEKYFATIQNQAPYRARGDMMSPPCFYCSVRGFLYAVKEEQYITLERETMGMSRRFLLEHIEKCLEKNECKVVDVKGGIIRMERLTSKEDFCDSVSQQENVLGS